MNNPVNGFGNNSFGSNGQQQQNNGFGQQQYQQPQNQQQYQQPQNQGGFQMAVDDNIAPSAGMGVVPKNKYPVCITAASYEPTKAQPPGSTAPVNFVLKLELTIEPNVEYAGRKIFDNYNLQNVNPDYQKWAQGDYAKLCLAIFGNAHNRPRDPSVLVGAKFLADVGIRKPKAQARQSEMGGYNPGYDDAPAEATQQQEQNQVNDRLPLVQPQPQQQGQGFGANGQQMQPQQNVVQQNQQQYQQPQNQFQNQQVNHQPQNQGFQPGNAGNTGFNQQSAGFNNDQAVVQPNGQGQNNGGFVQNQGGTTEPAGNVNQQQGQGFNNQQQGNGFVAPQF